MKWIKKIAILLSLCCCFSATGCLRLTSIPETCEECVDVNNDHRCDECNNRISECIDLDSNHLCEVCNVATSNCIDVNHNHICDVCDTVLSGCLDTDGDHHCDVCSTEISYCIDLDENKRCDTCGAGLGGQTPDSYVVNYYVDGILIDTKTVNAGEKAANLIRSDVGFYQFIGWTTNEAGTNFYDFTKEVHSNLTLYARYEIDYSLLTNQITCDYMNGIVSIHSSYRATDGYKYTSTGSGVIFRYDEGTGTYYLLTNNHVVYNYAQAQQAYRWSQLIVRDSYETEYDGTLLYHDAEYDLAIVKISKNERRELGVFEFADQDPVVEEEIVCIGNPYGQKNSITYGEVTGYAKCTLSEDSSHIDFSCVKHTAWMATGSSGGLLMNLKFKIIGINFAVNVHGATGEHMCSWAVPVSKVQEFITASGV